MVVIVEPQLSYLTMWKLGAGVRAGQRGGARRSADAARGSRPHTQVGSRDATVAAVVELNGWFPEYEKPCHVEPGFSLLAVAVGDCGVIHGLAP